MPRVTSRKPETRKSLLSPFRYPGGKSWLRPVIRRWLEHPVDRLVEPFAGGGNVTLTAISENLAKRATMIELDPYVAAVWQAMLDGEASWLSKQIRSFNPTRKTVIAEFNKAAVTLRQKAWLTLLRNRVSHGGILAPGSGLLKRGEDDNGIKSRWYPRTLSQRIAKIHELRDRITFIEGDGLTWLQAIGKALNGDSLAFFIDPPYATAGQRLYGFGQLDHEKLFEAASQLPGKVLMTYEDGKQVRKLAEKFGFAVQPIEMLSRQHVAKMELLIAKDLEWSKS